jgi:hypothetical protein
MVSFALTDFDLDLVDCLRGLPGLAAPDLFLFLSVCGVLALSRAPEFCPKACGDKMGMEKTKERKRIENRESKIE